MEEKEVYTIIAHIIGYAMKKHGLKFYGRADIIDNDWVIELVTVVNNRIGKMTHDLDLIEFDKYKVLDELVEKIDKSAKIILKT